MPVALPLVDLAPLVACCLALIVLVNLQALVNLLASIFNVIPVIGGTIASGLQRVIGGGLGTAAGWARSAIGGLVGVLWTSIKWIGSLFQHIGDGFVAYAQSYLHIVTAVVPGAIGTAVGFATTLYHQALAYVDQRILGVGAMISTAVNGVTQALDATAGQLANFATTLYHQALAYVDQTAGRLSGFATQLYHQALAYVDQTAGALAQFATTLYHQAVAYVDQTAGAIKDWVGGEVQTLKGDIGAVEGAIPVAIAGALAPVLARVGTIEATVTEVEDCVGPICEAGAAPTLSNLSNLLNDLTSLLDDGILFAFVAAAAANPGAVADDVVAVIGGAVNDAATAVRDVVGVAA